MKETNDSRGAYLVIAALVIIGLVWFVVDERSSERTAPCSEDYIAQYGSLDCQDYQQQQEQQSEYKDCGFRPTC